MPLPETRGSPYFPILKDKGIQFKMIITLEPDQLEIADGGFTDWTQQLLGDRKERLLISGFGLSLMQQLFSQAAG